MSNRGIIVITLLTLLVFFNVNRLNAHDFKISKGEQFELCREIEQILKEPENKDFAEPYLTDTNFSIPKKYKNFRLPKWEDVALDDLPKYMKSGRVLSEIQDFNAQKQIPWLLHGEKYGVTQKMVVQKTSLDFDHDGDKDTVLRYKVESDSIIYTTSSKQWRCYVSDAKEETVLSKGYNGIGERYYHQQKECNLFFYKGKVFKAHEFSSPDFGVFEPVLTRIGKSFGLLPVCYFDLGSRELNSEALQNSIKIIKDRLVQIKKLEKVTTSTK